MPTITPRLGLKKPLGNERVSREAYNENLEIIEQNAAKKVDVDDHGSRIDTLESEVEERPGPATIILNTYDKRVQSIMAKVAGGLNFELSGNMVVNLLGRTGSCEDLSTWTGYASTLAVDTTNKTQGNASLKATSNGTSGYIGLYMASSNKVFPFKENGKYFVGFKVRIPSSISKTITAATIYVPNSIVTSVVEGAVLSDRDKFITIFSKVDVLDHTAITNIGILIYTQSGNFAVTDYANFDEINIVKITDSEYSSLTQSQLGLKYPYVNSAQPILNPVIDIMQGKNLIRNGNCEEGISYWGEPVLSPTITIENGKFKFVSNSAYSYLVQRVKVKKNTDYYLSFNKSGVGFIRVFDKTITTPLKDAGVGIFNTGERTEIVVLMHDYGTPGTTYFDSIQLEEGTTATAYEPLKGTKTIAPCMLGKIGNNVDRLKYENGVFKKIKYMEKLVLDGNLAWAFMTDYAGYKTVGIALSQSKANNGVVSKYDGKILVDRYNYTTLNYDALNSSDQFWLGNVTYTFSGNEIIISLDNLETGWGEAYIPTQAEIQAFFNGYKMYDASVSSDGTGVYDGTGTKAWVYWNDAGGFSYHGTTLPTTQAPTNSKWQPYVLYYALAQPVEEIINIPSICELPMLSEGINTIVISSGLVYERVTPSKHTTQSVYAINALITYSPPNPLKNKPRRIVCVHKNHTQDSQWTINTNGTRANWQNGVYAYIDGGKYDPSAEYWVLYEVLPEEYNCQVLDCSGTYAENLKTAVETAQEIIKNLQKQAVRQIGDIPQRFTEHIKYGGIFATTNTPQSIPNATETKITFTEIYREIKFTFFNSNNPTRVTIPSNVARVRIVAHCAWQPSEIGKRYIKIQKNGADMSIPIAIAQRTASDIPNYSYTSSPLQIVVQEVPVVAGDYFELVVYQNSGNALGIASASRPTSLSLEVLE